MNASIILMKSNLIVNHASTGYIIGAFIALLFFAYLAFSLLKPEKF
jgi:K+-transporting ATPase KdpF subunit